MLVLGAIAYGSTINSSIAYFPNLLLPMTVGAIGLGMINVPLGLALIASVDVDRIGPTSAIAVMLQSLGGPLVLVGIQVVITVRTLHLGGTAGPVATQAAPALGQHTAQLLLQAGFTDQQFEKLRELAVI